MPEWKAELSSRLAAFNLPPVEEARIIEELSQHLDDRVAELLRSGLAEDASWRQALEEIADDELRRGGWRSLPVRSGCAPAPGQPRRRLAGSLVRDLRCAVRSLWSQPGFTFAAVAALALGIGGTTAIFGAVDAVLLRPMPFSNADRL